MPDFRDAPAGAQRLCDAGYDALEGARFDEAQGLLSRARDLAPEYWLVHYRLGLLSMDTGRLPDALAAFDAAIRLQPDDPRAHNNRGSVLQRLGRKTDAEAAFTRALELGPEHAHPWINLGHLLEEQGRPGEAVRLYERAIARGLDPDVFGHFAAAAAGRQTTRAPDHWVRATFDNFAPTFDAHMRGLGYRVPLALATKLRARIIGTADVLDLGCGTGQCGLVLAECRHRLVGVDLATKMLALARARGVYDELHCAEAHAWLRDAAPAAFDVVIAADVFIYIGALDALFGAVARVLRAGGAFAFSTEECDAGDYTLRQTGRYAQGEGYVRRLAQADFEVIDAEATIIRDESGKPVPGRLYLLQRR